MHLCIDMQRLFSSEGPWATPWMERVLPVVAEIASRFPERTVFTRFITPRKPEDMPGMWQRYYERWRETTQEQIDSQLLELMPPSRGSFRRDGDRQNQVFGVRRLTTARSPSRRKLTV